MSESERKEALEALLFSKCPHLTIDPSATPMRPCTPFSVKDFEGPESSESDTELGVQAPEFRWRHSTLNEIRQTRATNAIQRIYGAIDRLVAEGMRSVHITNVYLDNEIREQLTPVLKGKFELTPYPGEYWSGTNGVTITIAGDRFL